jgi:hypothetical protein
MFPILHIMLCCPTVPDTAQAVFNYMLLVIRCFCASDNNAVTVADTEENKKLYLANRFVRLGGGERIGPQFVSNCGRKCFISFGIFCGYLLNEFWYARHQWLCRYYRLLQWGISKPWHLGLRQGCTNLWRVVSREPSFLTMVLNT